MKMRYLRLQNIHVSMGGAIGYNVRYGIAPDKLYSSRQGYEKCELDIGILNAGQDYWFAVDSFNDNGITSGEVMLVSERKKRKHPFC